MKTSLLVVASLCLGLSALPACGAGSSREKVSLAYPGSDARDVSDHLSQAITDAGMSPNCKDRKFCKFKFNEQGTVHYKLLKRDPVLLLEIAADVPEEERGKLEREMTKLAQEIWGKASDVALTREKEDKQAKAEREAREAELDAEKHKVDTEARLELERIAAEERKNKEKNAAEEKSAAEAAMKVTDKISFEAKLNGGAALKVEQPEGAVCTTLSDNANVSKSLEVPFQIETTPGSFYTVECVLPKGATWRKKVQTKERFVTVVSLTQGGK